MNQSAPNILAVNVGSSSIKFAVYGAQLERIVHSSVEIAAGDYAAGAAAVIAAVEASAGLASLAAAGHRIVNGGVKHTKPELLTPALLTELRRISSWAPEHLPAEIAMVELLTASAPGLRQVACFDTAFHRSMPRVAKLLAIPHKYSDQGVERLGFHGLSFAFLMEELERVAGRAAARGRVILAHLGGGASIAAVRDGASIDTSMGFTPAAGIPMSTRTGDLDPGLVWYLAQTEGMTAERFNRMINHESGLLGVSGTSSDVRELLKREAGDPRAADALALFCYQTRKFIGAYAAALGGVDTIVFAGGIGGNSDIIRTRICDGLGFLGVQLDAARNESGAPAISSETSRVAVRVVHTDEEIMIAKGVRSVLERE